MAKKLNGSTATLSEQKTLFGNAPSDDVIPCDVAPIEKRRDGSTRYWCRAHRADATEKYGKPAQKCRLWDVKPVRTEDIKVLDLDKYPGGVALWGAAPAVYDTTKLPTESGIHVHARETRESEKDIDFTFECVRIVGKDVPASGIILQQTDALYYLISTVFGAKTTFVACTHCNWPHLDEDWFSVNPHRRHLCSGCGRTFNDRTHGIGNPIAAVRAACGAADHKIGVAPKNLNIKQSDFPCGIQIWGSNPAFLWTQHKDEESGIHVHAHLSETDDEPAIDDTFGKVTIDGISLDPEMVRVLMAQSVLPILKDRVQSIDCPACKKPHFDSGEAAYTPSSTHKCAECGHEFSTPGRMRKTVINPLPTILAELAKRTTRTRQDARFGLAG
jgi:transposase-like protein